MTGAQPSVHKVSFFNKPLIHLLTIIVFALLSYSNTFDVPFQLDDIDNIVNNPAIKKFEYFMDLSRIESPGNTDVFDKPLFRTRYIGYLTFALNHAAHGLDVRGYHLVNILIHLCTSLLLYCLVMFTFRTPRFMPSVEDTPCPIGSRNFIALFTALLFAVHPIQTQAVTYIVQRFTSLATLLFLLSLVSYIQFRLLSGQASDGFRRAALFLVSMVSAILAMKTKEFALLLPIVITLYEFMFLESRLMKRLQYLIPFFLTMVIVPLSLMNTADSGLVEAASKISGAHGGISSLDYMFTQFRVIVIYIRLFFFPVNQKFDYDYPVYRSFFVPEVVISFLFLFSIFLMSIYLYRLSRIRERRNSHLYRLASFGLFWFFITISAESSIIPIADVIFEHRLYLPSIGFFLAMVSAMELLRVKWGEQTSSVLTISVYAMLLLTVGLSTAAYSRNSLWRDRVGFMEDEVKKSPGKARARSTLASLYAEQGRMDEAIYQFKTTIANSPGYANAHYSLGLTYANMGRLEEAVQEYKYAVTLKFDFADAHGNLGVAYAKLGRMEEAIKEYGIALMITPYSAKAHNNLGNAYGKLGRMEETINEYKTALKLKPDFIEAHYNLGNTYAKLGRMEEAINEYRTALKLKPDFIEARQQLENYSEGIK